MPKKSQINEYSDILHLAMLDLDLSGAVFEEIWGTIGWDPSACKSNRLHVGILWFFYIYLRYIL
jgi:hypothetical protein